MAKANIMGLVLFCLLGSSTVNAMSDPSGLYSLETQPRHSNDGWRSESEEVSNKHAHGNVKSESGEEREIELHGIVHVTLPVGHAKPQYLYVIVCATIYNSKGKQGEPVPWHKCHVHSETQYECPYKIDFLSHPDQPYELGARLSVNEKFEKEALDQQKLPATIPGPATIEHPFKIHKDFVYRIVGEKAHVDLHSNPKGKAESPKLSLHPAKNGLGSKPKPEYYYRWAGHDVVAIAPLHQGTGKGKPVGLSSGFYLWKAGKWHKKAKQEIRELAKNGIAARSDGTGTVMYERYVDNVLADSPEVAKTKDESPHNLRSRKDSKGGERKETNGENKTGRKKQQQIIVHGTVHVTFPKGHPKPTQLIVLTKTKAGEKSHIVHWNMCHRKGQQWECPYQANFVAIPGSTYELGAKLPGKTSAKKHMVEQRLPATISTNPYKIHKDFEYKVTAQKGQVVLHATNDEKAGERKEKKGRSKAKKKKMNNRG